jgi:hypothetical protein
MVPGWHYNTLTAEDYLITREQALRFFYLQLLTGDATDNIPGLYRIGEKKAATMLPDTTNEKELYKAVLDAYAENLEKFGDNKQARERNFGRHEEPIGLLWENARLLWMLEHEDQLWTPPGMKDESIKGAGLLVQGDEFLAPKTGEAGREDPDEF